MRRKLCRLNYHIELAGFQKKYAANRTFVHLATTCNQFRCCVAGCVNLVDFLFVWIERKKTCWNQTTQFFFVFLLHSLLFYHAPPDTENKIKKLARLGHGLLSRSVILLFSLSLSRTGSNRLLIQMSLHFSAPQTGSRHWWRKHSRDRI
jgi:hypothetical protein